MKVVKNSGAIVEFNRDKLRQSLLRSGAETAVVENVIQEIERQLFDGVSTKVIYKIAGALLKKISASHAARYNLQTALQQLGPAGFFFEKFVARLFDHEKFDTKINLILQGHCVTHELDVVVKKANIITMVECKFHGNSGNSDVKIPMYILSRFNDLKDLGHSLWHSNEKIIKCCITTNSRFTSDAITFANCSGIELLSWDYPKNDNLKTKIDSCGLYPITCLTTLSGMEKEKLLILDVILVKELIANSSNLNQIGISANRQKNVLAEATSLCKYF